MKKRVENTLELINKSALRFLAPLKLEEVYVAIVQEAISLVNAEYGSIFLINKKRLKRVYASLDLLYKIRPKKGGLIYEAFSNQKPSVIRVKDHPEMHIKIKKMGTQSIVIIPLSYRNQSIGVLTVESTKEEKFNQKELDILKVFGSTATLAIIKARLYNETKEALENRDLFISLAAHELRTPLTTMNVYIEILKKKTGAKNKALYRIADQLSNESSRLGNLMDELLTLSRIKSGKLNYAFKQSNLTDLVTQAVTNFTFNHPDRKITILNKIKKDKDSIMCDNEKILQVITNLLDNAAKFSLDKKSIKLFLKNARNGYYICVEDRGVGIPEEDLERVFEGFYKGKDNHKQGLGLGLFLSKNIIDKHKGEINLYSVVGLGTTVEVFLPRSPFKI